MVAAAPGLFSTTTGWPSLSCSFWLTVRASTSVNPPGTKPTIMRIGLLGYWACAGRLPVNAAVNETKMARCNALMAFSSYEVVPELKQFSHRSTFAEPNRLGVRHLPEPQYCLNQALRPLLCHRLSC